MAHDYETTLEIIKINIPKNFRTDSIADVTRTSVQTKNFCIYTLNDNDSIGRVIAHQEVDGGVEVSISIKDCPELQFKIASPLKVHAICTILNTYLTQYI